MHDEKGRGKVDRGIAVDLKFAASRAVDRRNEKRGIVMELS